MMFLVTLLSCNPRLPRRSKAPAAHLNGLAVGPPPMPSTFLCQFEILGLLALVGLLYLDFPRDSKFQHDHLFETVRCQDLIWSECYPCNIYRIISAASLGQPSAANHELRLAAHRLQLRFLSRPDKGDVVPYWELVFTLFVYIYIYSICVCVSKYYIKSKSFHLKKKKKVKIKIVIYSPYVHIMVSLNTFLYALGGTIRCP